MVGLELSRTRSVRPLRAFRLAAALLFPLASACQDSLSPDPPAAADVSGFWVGTWTEEENDADPVSGQISLSFAQEANGDVTGVVTFDGIECLGTHSFTGAVSGLALSGLALDESVQVAFEVDASKTEDVAGSRILGSFVVDLGEGCAGLQAEFEAAAAAPMTGSPASPLLLGPQTKNLTRQPAAADRDGEASPAIRHAAMESRLQPLVAFLPPPAVNLSGSWSGLWFARGATGDSGARRLTLTLVQDWSGAVGGILALEGVAGCSAQSFTGWLSARSLRATAFDSGVRIAFDLEAVDATEPSALRLAGSFLIARGDECVGLEGSLLVRPASFDGE